METFKNNNMENKNEVIFSEMGMDKQLDNILYGIWSDEEEEENLLF